MGYESPKRVIAALDEGELTALKAAILFEHSEDVDIRRVCDKCGISTRELAILRETDTEFKDALKEIKKADDVALEFRARERMWSLLDSESESTVRAVAIHLDKKYDNRGGPGVQINMDNRPKDPVDLGKYAVSSKSGTISVRPAHTIPDDVGEAGTAADVKGWN